jgi:hypothetical protein
MFSLVLEGTAVRGVVASDNIDVRALGELWGEDVVVSGVAKYRPSGAVLRIEALRIERAETRDLDLWGRVPKPIVHGSDVHPLRQAQGPRSGINAMFGRLSADESDDDIIEALDQLS